MELEINRREWLERLDLEVRDVRSVDPYPTFRDKVIVLHGLRRWGMGFLSPIPQASIGSLFT